MERIEKIETLVTEDGSLTLLHPVLSDSYHSTQGAIQEALHVYIRPNISSKATSQLKVLEMGFGSGLNALLTAVEAMTKGIKIEYHTIELYPLAWVVAQNLNYTEQLDTAYSETELQSLFEKIHSAAWNEKCEINDFFTIKKIYGSFLEVELEENFDTVFWDAFSPDTQPELWSKALFEKVFSRLAVGATLTTYSAKGEVKKALREAGFTVKRMKGFGTKRHMIYAVKPEIV